ncbi:hypothetical protein PoB_003613800 [Plakobranchus ocellatus]|uniref:Uncharacterized protein n=1 Tax=Plakobranchus ocellatus TaxID=259542 RepID=A0AAV4AS42_9GAST|nr:hypothetical protein PoB_003613800 [Plakobranchus ocellatus]
MLCWQSKKKQVKSLDVIKMKGLNNNYTAYKAFYFNEEGTCTFSAVKFIHDKNKIGGIVYKVLTVTRLPQQGAALRALVHISLIAYKVCLFLDCTLFSGDILQALKDIKYLHYESSKPRYETVRLAQQHVALKQPWTCWMKHWNLMTHPDGHPQARYLKMKLRQVLVTFQLLTCCLSLT